MRTLLKLAVLLPVLTFAGVSVAEEWATARFNSQRNAFSAQEVDPTRLEVAWEYRATNPPSPAWHGPAKWDAYGDVRMHSMRNYDEVPQLIGAVGSVFFGSSVDDSVTCLDAATGEERWSFFTDGPVRIAPTYHDGRIYFGSDDGYAYCLDAESGEFLWKFSPLPPDRLVLNNGRFIPSAPIRSGVIVDNGVAYFAASLLPWTPSYLCAIDAETGSVEGDGRFVQHFDNMTFEGPLALSQRLVIAPQGRVPPLLFSRTSGKHLGGLEGGGGSFVVVLPNRKIVHGPGNKTGWVTVSSSDSREKLATHNNARAMVVDSEQTYLLTKSSIGATNTSSGESVWRTPCSDGIELIGVGTTLFVGKPDRIEAYSTADGRLMWETSLDGKVFGLSFANGHLLASTDLGVFYAFAPTAEPGEQPQPATPIASVPGAAIDVERLTPIRQKKEPGMLGRWVFQPPHLNGFEAVDLAGNQPAAIAGVLSPMQVGQHAALALADGETSITIADDLGDARLPNADLTATAWVRIDKPQPWGGIIGVIQDNGADENGWILGYRESKFCFGVATQQGSGALTYLTADEPFTVGAWHHVAGVYDGKTTRLYVDGLLAATTDVEAGPIKYAPEGPFVIGAYRDKDENFPLVGMVHEVRMYERALPTSQIAKQYRAKADRFPAPAPPPAEPETYQVAVGPWLQFTKPDEAVIRWQTANPSPTILELRLGDDLQQRIATDEPTTKHEVRLESLDRKRLYHYTIEFLRGGEAVHTQDYECDTFFNYALKDAARDDGTARDDHDQWRLAAEAILRRASTTSGICLDWNAGSCRLAEQIVRQSNLRVLCLSSDARDVAEARSRLREAGLYGSRIVVRYANSPSDLRLTPHWANLLVSGTMLNSGELPGSGEQIQQALAPGGRAVLGVDAEVDADRLENSIDTAFGVSGDAAPEIERDPSGAWAVFEAPQFTRTGDWSYIYGGADNTAYGGESLAGAKTSDDLAIQWLGRPGPRYQADRNGRKTPPLSFGGRLFLEGLHRIVAVDIYNGAVQWSLEVPHFERFNVPRDCANWCGSGESLFAAIRDRCWRIDVASGKVRQMYATPAAGDDNFDWGYVAVAEDSVNGDVVIGSAVKPGTSYTDFWGSDGWYDAAEGPQTFKVCSDALFAVDKLTGKQRWSYSQGLVVNSTITLSNGRLFFVEGRDPSLRTADARRVNSTEFWQSQHLVALNATTGEVVWELPLETMDGKVVFYMAHSGEKLIIVSSNSGKFHVYALADHSGAPLWDLEFPWGREGKADHGSHLSRPAIVGDRLFVRPAVIDLQTGQLRDEKVPEGKCGTYSCTDYALFFRGDPGARFAMWSSMDNQYSLWNRLRPDCWLSSIPAGGMLLSPEGGGGCSCGSWMETSIGFIPRARLGQQ